MGSCSLRKVDGIQCNPDLLSPVLYTQHKHESGERVWSGCRKNTGGWGPPPPTHNTSYLLLFLSLFLVKVMPSESFWSGIRTEVAALSDTVAIKFRLDATLCKSRGRPKEGRLGYVVTVYFTWPCCQNMNLIKWCLRAKDWPHPYWLCTLEVSTTSWLVGRSRWGSQHNIGINQLLHFTQGMRKCDTLYGRIWSLLIIFWVAYAFTSSYWLWPPTWNFIMLEVTW